LLSKLTETDQKRLARAAELAKLPLDSLAQYRPWLAAFTVEQSYYSTLNLPESGSAEKVLMPRATKDGVTIMPRRIELSRAALADFDDIYDFIARDNPRAAAQVLRSLDESIQLHTDQP
jgi:hypothetical protein